jgi:hypothetical protein
MIVHEAMFITNVMLTINGHTPYTAVYGRTPHMLPDLNVLPDEVMYDAHNDVPLRDVRRVREIAIQSIMAETARVRLSRALTTKTGIAGVRLNLQAGDRGDYFRDDGPKDKS